MIKDELNDLPLSEFLNNDNQINMKRYMRLFMTTVAA